MSDVDLEEELLAVAGRGGKKRSRPRPDHDDEDYGSFQWYKIPLWRFAVLRLLDQMSNV